MKQQVFIVTNFQGSNYGSSLQCFALSHIIGNMGYDVVIVDRNETGFAKFVFRINVIAIRLIKGIFHPSLMKKQLNSKFNKKKVTLDTMPQNPFAEFEKTRLNIQQLSYKELKKASLNDKCAFCVVGSDQIWNPEEAYSARERFLLFCPKEKTIAYAPSFGQTFIYNYNRRIFKKGIKHINFLSCREESGIEVIHNLTGREALLALDPTLLLDSNEWINTFYLTKCHEKTTVLYFLGKFPDYIEDYIRHLISNGEKCVVITNNTTNNQFLSNHTECIKINPAPEKFVEEIYKSSFVITDSFHGTVFSIIFEKNFISLPRDYEGLDGDGGSRIVDMLNRYNLLSRYAKTRSDFEKIIGCNADYSFQRNKISEDRKRSLEYLNNSIASINN